MCHLFFPATLKGELMKLTNTLTILCAVASSITLTAAVSTSEKSSRSERMNMSDKSNKDSLTALDNRLKTEEQNLDRIRQELANLDNVQIKTENMTPERRAVVLAQLDRDRRDAKRLEDYVGNTLSDLRKDADRLRSNEEQLDKSRVESRTAAQTRVEENSKGERNVTQRERRDEVYKNNPEIARLSQEVEVQREDLKKDLAQLNTDESRLEKEVRDLQRKAGVTMAGAESRESSRRMGRGTVLTEEERSESSRVTTSQSDRND
jgi:hypothetical protein